MAYTFGARLDDDSYALTTIDEDQGTASTKGEINGVPFESGGGSSEIPTAEVVFTDTVVGAGNSQFYGYHEDENYNYELTAFAKMGETYYSFYMIPRNSSMTFTLYLVGGYGIIDPGQYDVAVTGNAEVVYDSVIGTDVIKITGSCTITISAEA